MRSVVRRKYGPHRHPMADPRTDLSAASSARWPGSSLARHARGGGWRVVGAPHGSALARPAGALSSVPNVSSTISSVATHGGAPAIAHAAGGGPPRSRETRSQRGLRRRELQLGKKGAPPLDLLDVVRAAKSWRSATAMVFLSPFTWPALRHMKPASLTPPSRRDSSKRSRPV